MSHSLHGDDSSLYTLARRATSSDNDDARRAREALRAGGENGALALHARPSTPAVDAALDEVCAQRGARKSGLFWHTELEAALVEARRRERPVLSLRMLGRLDEDLSCANSRFFRQWLYSDSQTATFLRTRFVLHWHSVRPVPRLTVDFGDGRRFEQTVTGNSMHLVLDRQGRPVDLLPGLFTPQDFMRLLSRSAEVARELGECDSRRRDERLKTYHAHACTDLLRRWRVGLESLGKSVRTDLSDEALALESSTTETVWTELARSQGPSRRHPRAAEAAGLAMTKKMVELPLLRALGELGHPQGEESLRNEFQLQRRVHERLRELTTDDEASITEWAYQELFLMPLSDPWLGLRAHPF